ncbi:MAG: AMP-binding protein [Halobacteria archaeon]
MAQPPLPLLQRQFRRALRAPAYRAKFGNARVRTLEEFRALPTTAKPELMEAQAREPPFGGFLAVPKVRISRVTVSPGPIFEPRTRGERQEALKHNVPVLRMQGVRMGDVVLITYSLGPMPAGLGLMELCQAVGATAVPSGPGESERQLEFIRKLRCTVFAGTPSYFVKLGEFAKERGLDPTALGLRVSLHGAEPLPPALRAKIVGLFACEPFDRYGVAEIGNIGAECRAHRGLHVNPGVHLELLEPGTDRPVKAGETGEIVVTPLTSEAMPLIRYRTGDLSQVMRGPCPCGRPGPRLSGIAGRADESRKVRGVFVHPSQVAKALEGLAEKFQIVIERPGASDVMTVRIEGAEETKGEAEVRLKKVLGLDVNVEAGKVEGGRLVDKRELSSVRGE